MLFRSHSNVVRIADRAGVAGDGDALVTNVAGVAVSVRTADCYPILLADMKNRAIAAVHAGWRGTAGQILLATLHLMSERFSTKPAWIRAAIGPGIGMCCYEVGSDVARQFGLQQAGCLDLAAANHSQLVTDRKSVV